MTIGSLWACAPRWAVYAFGPSIVVVLIATALGGLDLGAVWARFVQLNFGVLAIGVFLLVVRMMNSISGNSFDESFEAARGDPLGRLGIMLYYGLRIVAVAAFLGQVYRW